MYQDSRHNYVLNLNIKYYYFSEWTKCSPPGIQRRACERCHRAAQEGRKR